MQEIVIRKGIDADATSIASLHMHEIDQGFLSELGLRFLTMFYPSAIESGSGFCIVGEQEGEIVGFVCGTTSLSSLYKAFLMRHTVQAIPVILPKLFNVQRIKKIVETLLYPSKKESMYILDGAIRTAGSQTVNIPGTYAGDTVELFIAFVSADGTQVSNSLYLGSGTAA